MSMLNYGILCEDKAHFTFITTFLKSFAKKHHLQIKYNEDFFLRFKASNSKEVLKKFSAAAIIGFRDYQLDLLVIGIDYDDRDRDNFNSEVSKLYIQLDERFTDKSVIMFPVQAVEHWLLYIQYHLSNPTLTKNISFEQISRKEAKVKIYGKKYSRNNQILIKSLIDKLEVNWLISRSESFRKFYTDLEKKLIR